MTTCLIWREQNDENKQAGNPERSEDARWPGSGIDDKYLKTIYLQTDRYATKIV